MSVQWICLVLLTSLNIKDLLSAKNRILFKTPPLNVIQHSPNILPPNADGLVQLRLGFIGVNWHYVNDNSFLNVVKYHMRRLCFCGSTAKFPIKKDRPYSKLKIGVLHYNINEQTATLEWPPPNNSWTTNLCVLSDLNEDGQNTNKMPLKYTEFSDLFYFKGNLMTVTRDNSTLYKIDHNSFFLTKWIDMEEESKSAKMQYEWATEKDNELYLGSIGTSKDTMSIIKINNNNVELIEGKLLYEALQEKAKTQNEKTKMTHKACVWSKINGRFFFIPEKSGLLLSANSDLTDCKYVKTVGASNTKDLHYTSFKFVPYSNDKVIVALQNGYDEECSISECTFISVFHIDGKVLVEPTKIQIFHTFYGVEFLNSKNY